MRSLTAFSSVGVAALLLLRASAGAEAPSEKELAHEIFQTMIQVHGVDPHQRPVHAKGLVCHGSFEPTKDAATLSKAGLFKGGSVPVTVRFSDGAPEPMIPDNSPNAGPQGMAVRFAVPGGEDLDIVAISHNGFVVADGLEFLELQKSIVATDPGKPHPWPIEAFLGSHPAAMKFVVDNRVAPSSFANESFFGNNAFILVNKEGAKRAARFKILPLAGAHSLSEAEAKEKSADFLMDDLRARLPKEPIKFSLVVQLANPGDQTKDPTLVWPDDRKAIELGTITVRSVAPDSDAAQDALAFDPTNLPDGIELSDDPFPSLRSKVYALSAKHRRRK